MMENILFSDKYFPPAPVLQIQLAVPDQSPTTGLISAMIDTGADGTFVSTTLLEELNIPLLYMTNVRSHFGEKLHRVGIYKIDIVFEDRSRLVGIEVVSDDYDTGIILGRNVLNKLKILLDGPNQTTNLLDF